MRWFLEVVSLELRRIASSRVEFWTKIALATVTQGLVAYYLWGEILAASGRETIGGYDLSGMVAYYVVAALVFNLINPEFDLIAREIYDGGINRFLIYPVSLFSFKYAGVVARVILAFFQISCVWLALKVLGPSSLSGNWSAQALVIGLVASAIAATTYYLIIAAVELSAFWVESVWNARLALQFTLTLLGGYMIPISAFPEGMRRALELTPLPWMIALPIRSVLGEAGVAELARGATVMGLWSVIFIFIIQKLWRRGRVRYVGTGL